MVSDELRVNLVWCLTHVEVLNNFTEMFPTCVTEVLEWTGAAHRKLVLFLYEVHERIPYVLFHELARSRWHVIESFFEVDRELACVSRG